MRWQLSGIAVLFFISMGHACVAPSSAENEPVQTATLSEGYKTATPVAITPTLEIINTITPQQPGYFTPLSCEPGYCVYPAPSLLFSPIPADKNQIADVAYRYGSTQMGEREAHLGIELVNASGTPVLAAANGEVIVAGNDDETRYHPYIQFYGNLVILKHEFSELGFPMYTLYAHLSRIDVEVGQIVTAGQQIGLVGASGAAIGSHLHFEVRLRDMEYTSTSNPELWLAPVTTSDSGQMGILAVHVNNPKNISLKSLQVTLRSTSSEADTTLPIYGEMYDKNITHTQPWDEFIVLGNITPGDYEIVFEKNGIYYRASVTIEPGNLTLAYITIN
jgi:murein DD-endopeptidase MepM/ murein hydrolase activator NlpD